MDDNMIYTMFTLAHLLNLSHMSSQATSSEHSLLLCCWADGTKQKTDKHWPSKIAWFFGKSGASAIAIPLHQNVGSCYISTNNGPIDYSISNQCPFMLQSELMPECEYPPVQTFQANQPLMAVSSIHSCILFLWEQYNQFGTSFLPHIPMVVHEAVLLVVPPHPTAVSYFL